MELKVANIGELENFEYIKRITRYIVGNEGEKRKAMKAIVLAYQMARTFHSQEKRKSGEDYFNHVKRVTYKTVEFFKESDPGVIIAALFHDVLENKKSFESFCNIVNVRSGTHDEAFEKLGEMFGEYGPHVAEMVLGLTNIKKVDRNFPEEKSQEYKRKVTKNILSDEGVFKVKLADLHDNAIPPRGVIEYENLERMNKYLGSLFPFETAIIKHFSRSQGENDRQKKLLSNIAHRKLKEIRDHLEERINLL